MYDIDNLSCIIRSKNLHIANDDQRIQTEREEGREREKEWKRERREERERRHGPRGWHTVDWSVPRCWRCCQLLDFYVPMERDRQRQRQSRAEQSKEREREREQRRPLRSPSGTSSPTKRTEPASIPPLRRPNSHPLTFPLSPVDHQPPFFTTAISSLSLSCSSHN